MIHWQIASTTPAVYHALATVLHRGGGSALVASISPFVELDHWGMGTPPESTAIIVDPDVSYIHFKPYIAEWRNLPRTAPTPPVYIWWMTRAASGTVSQAITDNRRRWLDRAVSQFTVASFCPLTMITTPDWTSDPPDEFYAGLRPALTLLPRTRLQQLDAAPQLRAALQRLLPYAPCTTAGATQALALGRSGTRRHALRTWLAENDWPGTATDAQRWLRSLVWADARREQLPRPVVRSFFASSNVAMQRQSTRYAGRSWTQWPDDAPERIIEGIQQVVHGQRPTIAECLAASN